MKVDLHVHTTKGSPCSKLTPKELVLRARELGLDGVCITEHGNFNGKKIRSSDQDLIILYGVEIRSNQGDFLVYGLEDSIPFGDAQTVIDECKGMGCAIFVAHPYRFSVPSLGDLIYELKDYDGIEVLNGNATKDQNFSAKKAQKDLKCKGIGGSDAHDKKKIAKYVTVFENEIKNEDDLVTELIKGKYYPKPFF
ncbi:MAG: PHP-associated domain-containing protein [Candidatus Hydrothermarchaeota archaeon]